jgi:hypothetical protein
MHGISAGLKALEIAANGISPPLDRALLRSTIWLEISAIILLGDNYGSCYSRFFEYSSDRRQ